MGDVYNWWEIAKGLFKYEPIQKNVLLEAGILIPEGALMAHGLLLHFSND